MRYEYLSLVVKKSPHAFRAEECAGSGDLCEKAVVTAFVYHEVELRNRTLLGIMSLSGAICFLWG